MSQEKKPFHEVLSLKLAASPVGIGGNGVIAALKAAEVTTILDVLGSSKMKAADAHKIAEDHAELPANLELAGADRALVSFAEEVLNDLRNRQDEKKGESQTYTHTDLLLAADPTPRHTI